MMFLSANVHTDHTTEYDTEPLYPGRRDGDTWTIKARSVGGAVDATLFFRNRMELDRFVAAVVDAIEQHDAEQHDERMAAGPSAEQERAWSEQYDGTSLGA